VSKGAHQVLPKIAVAVSPKRAPDIRKFLRWEKNKQGDLEVLLKRALAVLPNVNEWVGHGESPLLDQFQRQDPLNSHGQASALTEVRAEQSGALREPGIVAQALKLCYWRAYLFQRSAVFACAVPVWRGACTMGLAGSLHLSGQ